MNINDKIAKFSEVLLESTYYANTGKKGDMEDIIILARMIFGEEISEEDYPFIEEILHTKYLCEVI